MKRLKSRWQSIALAFIAVCMGLLVVSALVFVVDSSRQFRRIQDQQAMQLEHLQTRVVTLEGEKQELTQETEEAKAQANTSVDQLVKEGIAPVITSEDVVTVPTQPHTTTTQPPVVVQVPQSTTSTTTSTTTVPTTTTTSTTTTTTTTEPPTTTTTVPPTSEEPPLAGE